MWTPCAVAERFSSKYAVEQVELIDPWLRDDPSTPENEMRITLSFADFRERVDFVTTRADADAVLRRWQELVEIDV